MSLVISLLCSSDFLNFKKISVSFVVGLIREALEQWLPPQEKFYRFASENGFPGASGKPSHSVTNEKCTKSQRARYS